MAKLKLKIVTPERTIYHSEVSEISLPTRAGRIGILPNHSPLISVLGTGEMILKKDGEEIPLALSGGILEVKPGSEVVVLADHSELAHEIDLKQAEEAYARAQKVMSEKEKVSDVDFARFESEIEREFNRVKIAGKYQKKHH